MADPIWTDGVTPLNSVNMTKLQTRDEKNAPSGYVGLDASKAIITGAITAAGNISSLLAAGDSQPQIVLSRNYFGSGLPGIAMGPGGVTAPDINLYRSAVGQLVTDSNFRTAGYLDVDFAGTGGKLRFGSAVDTNLYRHAAGQLRTGGVLVVDGSLYVDYASAGNKLYFDGGDTNLYRSAAGILQTDGMLSAQVAAGGAALAARRTGDSGWGWYVGDRGQMSWGLAAGTYDTNLYRAAAGALQTDGAFYATGAIQANYTTSNLILLHTDGKLYFGNAADTNLYRWAAGTLRTSGSFNADGNINAKTGAGVTNGECALGNYGPGGASALWLGPSEILYRLGSGIIATGSFACTFPGQGLVTAHALEVGAADSGGAGKRMVVVGN